MSSLDKFISKYSWLAMPVLRYGIAAVYFYFAISQLLDPEMFTFYLPNWISSVADPVTVVYANAVFELVFASLLVIGKFTRISALLLALHLLAISISLGFTQNGVRDFGLTIATFAIFLAGPDKLCLEAKKSKKK